MDLERVIARFEAERQALALLDHLNVANVYDAGTTEAGRPYFVTLRTGGIEHIRQVIRETDPKTPSTRLSELGEEVSKVAESRQTEVEALARCLHRELERILLKAMRKERSERYRSASELADDIENYLNEAPLIAGPPSTIYTCSRAERIACERHRTNCISSHRISRDRV